jgi:hypothetical protein
LASVYPVAALMRRSNKRAEFRNWPNPDVRRAALNGSLTVKSGHLGTRWPEKLKHSPSTVTRIVQFQ